MLDKVQVELETAFTSIRATIEKAPGRESRHVNLLAVSKGQSAESIATLYELKQRDFAENYLQEALEKQSILHGKNIVWHFIGRIQSRKAKTIAENFSWVHTLDSEKVALKLNKARSKTALSPLQVCIQVNISADPDKAGVAIDEVHALCQQLKVCPHLQLRGLMTILKAGLTEEEKVLDYRKMAELFAELNKRGYAMDSLSMGMSGDYLLAISAGANWVRIGEALFGPRKKIENK